VLYDFSYQVNLIQLNVSFFLLLRYFFSELQSNLRRMDASVTASDCYHR